MNEKAWAALKHAAARGDRGGMTFAFRRRSAFGSTLIQGILCHDFGGGRPPAGSIALKCQSPIGVRQTKEHWVGVMVARGHGFESHAIQLFRTAVHAPWRMLRSQALKRMLLTPGLRLQFSLGAVVVSHLPWHRNPIHSQLGVAPRLLR